MNINEITVKDFFDKVTAMYEHNLLHYSEEKPTIDGAFREVLWNVLKIFTMKEKNL